MTFAQSEAPLKPAVAYSFAAHILVISICLIVQSILQPRLKIQPTVYQVDLVSLPGKMSPKPIPEAAAPAQTVKPSAQLPRATIEELKEAKPKTQLNAMPEVKKPKTPEVKATPNVVPKADKVDHTKDIARIQEELKREKAIASILAKTAQSTSTEDGKGTAVAGGTKSATETGAGVTGADVGVQGAHELAVYREAVRNQVLSAWNLPQSAIDALPPKTFAIILVQIGENGELLSMRFEKSSQIAFFDESATRAVRRATPLPPPPKSLAAEIKSKGLAMRFTPTKVGP